MYKFLKRNLLAFAIIIAALFISASIIHPLRFQLSEINWDSISAIVIAITVIYVARQAYATEKLAEHEMRPAVEVSMFLADNFETYFQFARIKDLPALVWIKVCVQVDNHEMPIDSPRLRAEEPFRIIHKYYQTAAYNFLQTIMTDAVLSNAGEITASLEIFVAPIFEEEQKYRFYKKYYRFSGDGWVEINWGMPDKKLFDPSKSSA